MASVTQNKNNKNNKKTFCKKPKSNITTCNSVRSKQEIHLRCLLKAKNNEKYCALHLSQDTIIDYVLNTTDTTDTAITTVSVPKPLDLNNCPTVHRVNEIGQSVTVQNPIFGKVVLKLNPLSETKVESSSIDLTTDKTDKTGVTLLEQKTSTVKNIHEENEDDLQVKLLMLVNENEYNKKISKLIGPVFKDVTLSEDNQDPVTYDTIWTMENSHKIPATVNKYYLFSYVDEFSKIRCLTIFTIYGMLQEDNFVHPITMKNIPEKDVRRAKKLITFYKEKIGLFKELDESLTSPEYALKNKISKLFKKFHTHSIYFEDEWILNIKDKASLYKVITETDKLISANASSINPTASLPSLFKWKSTNQSSTKSILELQTYIVNEWIKLIQFANNNQNQIPIWILASGLAHVVPEIKQKFPDLEFM